MKVSKEFWRARQAFRKWLASVKDPVIRKRTVIRLTKSFIRDLRWAGVTNKEVWEVAMAVIDDYSEHLPRRKTDEPSPEGGQKNG